MLTHQGTQTIQTPRLTLRRFVPGDAQAMFERWANDEQVTRYLTWTPHETPEATKQLLTGWCEAYRQPETYNWAMEYEGEPIGNISVVRQSPRDETAELGYCMSRAFWNRGIMTEAAGAVIRWLLEQVGFHRIVICHAVKNPASGRVAQKCGMQLEGIHRHAAKSPSGEFLDIAQYAVLRDEWNTHGTNQPTKRTVPLLWGEKVLLRPVRESDIDDRLAIGRHHEFVHMCGGEALPAPEYPERSVWEAWYQSIQDDPFCWILEVGGRCIGSAGFHQISDSDHSAVYRIGIFDPRCHSQGIGTEATRLLLKYGFEAMGWHRIECRVLDYNKRAIRCYEKCGFHREGVLRDSAYIGGNDSSDIVMGILEEEYRRRHTP